MTSRRGFLAGTAVSALSTGAVAAATRKPVVRRWIPGTDVLDDIPRVMQLAGLPGLSMAVLERGALAWQRNFGVADVQTQAPLRDDTLFEAASTSKPVFAYGVLQLVERGVLDLDRPLAIYHRPPYLPADARLDRITARHVLTHTSGLRNWAKEGDADTFRPLFDPGTRVCYSGEGFFWLQLVVEKISGQGLDAFMQDVLLERAGMTQSMFMVDADAGSRVAYGHTAGRRSPRQGMRDILDRVTPLASAWNKPLRNWTHDDWVRSAAALDPGHPTQRVRFQNAAASLFTTAADYARFLSLFMDDATRAPWQIGDDLRRQAIAPRVPVRTGATLARGLGWSMERCDGEHRFGHEGNNDNRFTAYVAGEARTGNGLVILANAGAGFPVYQWIVRRVTGCDQLSFLADLALAETAA
jgi:CubicO group peptidase (beta-lactamase class C family)